MGNTATDIESAESTITINTSRFGEVNINQEKLITLASPLLGFPEDQTFALLPHGSDSPFFWLQSTSTPDLAFVVIQPSIINSNYNPSLPISVKHDLQSANEQSLDLMVILTIPAGKPQEMTANLLGPVVFNSDKRIAKQVLLDPGQYDPCWPVPLGN